MSDRLMTDQALQAGQELTSPNGQFSLKVQSDGNLVVYNGAPNPANAIYSSGTFTLPQALLPVSLAMQGDANLVLYDRNSTMRWSSGTYGPEFVAPYAVMQDDGNLVIYHGGSQVVWAIGTFPGGVGRVPGRGWVSPSKVQAREFKDLGAGHTMESTVTLDHGGHIDATTRTRSSTWLGGFTGGISVLFVDGGGIVIGQSGPHNFGVDGTLGGRSDRTDYWSEDIIPDLAARTASMTILHYWAPKWGALQNMVKVAVAAAQPAIPLIASLKSAGIL